MMLVVDCCVRGDASSTRQYYEAYLRKNGYTEENVAVLKLAEQDLAPLTNVDLEKRDALRYAGKYDDAMFDLARQFRDADEILVAAPFWDLSFPSILKVYLEHVSVCDITFGYASDGSSVGYCKAKRLLYFSSCGGFVGAEHLGFAYVKAFTEMMGIHDCEAYTLEGMDIDPSKRKDLLEHAIAAL